MPTTEAEAVWWLTWCIYLTGLRDNWAGCKTLLLGVSARVFQEGLAFALVDWVKIPIIEVGGISHTSESLHGIKRQICCFVWGGASIFSHPWMMLLLVLGPLDSGTYTSSSPLVLRHLDLGWTALLVSLSLQLMHIRWEDFLASIFTQTNSYKKFFIYFHFHSIGCFFREPWNTPGTKAKTCVLKFISLSS